MSSDPLACPGMAIAKGAGVITHARSSTVFQVIFSIHRLAVDSQCFHVEYPSLCKICASFIDLFTVNGARAQKNGLAIQKYFRKGTGIRSTVISLGTNSKVDFVPWLLPLGLDITSLEAQHYFPRTITSPRSLPRRVQLNHEGIYTNALITIGCC